MDHTDNANQGNPERLIAGANVDRDEEQKTGETDRLTQSDTLPEEHQGRSEADKEADTRPEDFESFNVDKVDGLQKAKEDYNPEEENN